MKFFFTFYFIFLTTSLRYLQMSLTGLICEDYLVYTYLLRYECHLWCYNERFFSDTYFHRFRTHTKH